MRVREVMSHSPTCCTQNCSAQTAARIMRQSGLGFLPVIDTEAKRHLVGILTDRDLCLNVVAAGRDVSQTPVQECMTPTPVACGPEDKAEEVLRLMEAHAVRRLPVIDADQRILGVIALTDLIHHGAASARHISFALGRIGEPRARWVPTL